MLLMPTKLSLKEHSKQAVFVMQSSFFAKEYSNKLIMPKNKYSFFIIIESSKPLFQWSQRCTQKVKMIKCPKYGRKNTLKNRLVFLTIITDFTFIFFAKKGHIRVKTSIS
jgi:hypothetical protein